MGRHETSARLLQREFHDLGVTRIFSRFDKIDVMFTAFIHFALIVEALR